MIDRRTFLQIPLVFGLHELFIPAEVGNPAGVGLVQWT
jgi:hypothetical protein